jgi:hypothetical protein
MYEIAKCCKFVYINQILCQLDLLLVAQILLNPLFQYQVVLFNTFQ